MTRLEKLLTASLIVSACATLAGGAIIHHQNAQAEAEELLRQQAAERVIADLQSQLEKLPVVSDGDELMPVLTPNTKRAFYFFMHQMEDRTDARIKQRMGDRYIDSFHKQRLESIDLWMTHWDKNFQKQL